MSVARREPSEELRAGRRGLEAIAGCTLLTDLTWEPGESAWRLQLRLTADVATHALVPATTDWVVLLDAAYPAGRLDVYPAERDSIEHTFPHQIPNRPGRGRPWRSGKLCLDLGVHALGRREFDAEPMTADDRLAWHVRRAQDWIAAASRDDLIRVGERYELPAYPSLGHDVFAFSEDAERFRHWAERSDRWGVAQVRRYRSGPDLYTVRSFATSQGHALHEVSWGYELSNAPEAPDAVWIRLRAAPVVHPYEPPRTWGDLRAILEADDINVRALLGSLPASMREGKRHLALLGFPIAERVGEAPRHLFWQAIRLPPLAEAKTSARGFRPGPEGWALHDVRNALADGVAVQWIRSENWSPDDISSRGRLLPTLRGAHAVLIGAGALGSVVGELLVRAGLRQLTVLDDEHVAGGNLVRHTLGLEQVGLGKAEALAARLNQSGPHARVDGIAAAFVAGPTRPGASTGTSALTSAGVVLDCTGSDEVLERMGAYTWAHPRVFASISLGLHAERVFVLLARGTTFPQRNAMRLLQPWLEHEHEALREIDLPREGLGCWHPLHPARVDDVWRMAATAVREVEQYVETGRDQTVLIVYEATTEGMRRGETIDAGE